MSTQTRANKIEISLLVFLFFHFAIGVYTGRYNIDYFENVYVVEDGVMEWYTVDALLMCAAICGYRFVKLRKKRPPLFVGVLAFLTLLFIFGAGEELSWGQRVFDVRSSQFFLENNAQGETNLHNLVVGDTKINKVVFSKFLGASIISYILVFPVLYAKLGWIRGLASRFAVPVPRLRHIVSYLVVGLAELVVISSKKGELLEFGGCFLFVLILAYPKNAELFQEQDQQEHDGAESSVEKA